jgi:DNA polymerase I-like protein with 3'-5' exonuclease and polymerase domains
MGFELSLVVHDEIVGWAPEATAEQALAEVKRLMMNSVTLNCPLQAEGHTGQTWQQAKG